MGVTSLDHVRVQRSLKKALAVRVRSAKERDSPSRARSSPGLEDDRKTVRGSLHVQLHAAVGLRTDHGHRAGPFVAR